MKYVKALSAVALLISICWLFASPGFESILAAIVSMSALISAFAFRNSSSATISQKQQVSNTSFGIQAGGDVDIGSRRQKNDA